jgi:hypothetical protein
MQGCAADSDHVASCKERGAAAFGRGQYRQAAQLFSEALRYCDEAAAGEDGAQLAARLYCNRALCLSKLQPRQLEAALADAAAAIAADPSFAKGWYRRAATLRALGRGASPAALADARRALQLLQQQGGSATEAATLVAELEAEHAAGAADTAASPAAAGAADAVSESSPPAAAAGEGNTAPAAASEAVANGHATPGEVAAAAASAHGDGEPAAQQLLRAAAPLLVVQQAAEGGRGLAAAGQLPAGTDVLRDQPFVHAPTKKGRRSVSGQRYSVSEYASRLPARWLRLLHVHSQKLATLVCGSPALRFVLPAWPRSRRQQRPSTAAAAPCQPTAPPPAAPPTRSTSAAAQSAGAPGERCCRRMRCARCARLGGWRRPAALQLPSRCAAC